MIKKYSGIICLATAALFMFFAAPALAKEINYPVYSYDDAELAKVRAWEKEWVGKTIDKSNVDSVKEFLPPSQYDFISNPEIWGASSFTVVPYETYPFTPGKIKFTREGNASLDKDDILQNYVAGVPFPEPKNGAELSWNFWTWNRFDASERKAYGWITDGRLKYDRDVGQLAHSMQFSGRTDTAPVPEVPNNRKQVFRASMSTWVNPAELRGNITLELRYKDWAREYDAWQFSAANRRVRRLSTAERMETIDGADFSREDSGQWDGLMTRNTYDIVGRKDMLICRHQDMTKLVHEKGVVNLKGWQKERIKLWIVGVKSKEKGHIYSKQTWYVDPELWKIMYSEKYDKYGKLWRTQEHAHVVQLGMNGVTDVEYYGSNGIDVQRKHSTHILLDPAGAKMGYNAKTSFFTPKNLLKLGR
jgi:hypothetical protein